MPLWYRASRAAGIGEILYLKHNLLVESALPKLLQVKDKELKQQIVAAYQAPHPFPDDRIGILRFTRMVPHRMGDESFDEIGEIDAALHQLDVPAHALWARKDPAFRKAIAHAFMASLPQGDPSHIIDLPQAGHFLQEDEPETINDHLRAILGIKA